MSVNSSSTSNPPPFCTKNEITMYMFATVIAMRTILLLPLSTFILYLGHQRWRQQHRSSKTATHSDIFTYNVAAMELLWILGCFFYFGGLYTNQSVVMTAGLYMTFIGFCGEIFFHVLTCVERYLAVVHPITYRGLRNARGVRIRNICIECVWLLCFGLSAVLSLSSGDIRIQLICLLVFSITIMSFCSLSVLCVLIRPGPGEGGGEKERIDQTKRRAFYTVTAISVTVWFWLVGLLVAIIMNTSPQLRNSVGCVVLMGVNWFILPSSLVSPLLYLYRAGKLSCCCRNSE